MIIFRLLSAVMVALTVVVLLGSSSRSVRPGADPLADSIVEPLNTLVRTGVLTPHGAQQVWLHAAPLLTGADRAQGYARAVPSRLASTDGIRHLLDSLHSLHLPSAGGPQAHAPGTGTRHHGRRRNLRPRYHAAVRETSALTTDQL